MDDLPLEIPCATLREWLSGRSTVLKGKSKQDFAWLVEEAVVLAQAVRYDVPTLRATIAKSRKVLSDADRRQHALDAQKEDATKVLRKRCEELNLPTDVGDYAAAITQGAQEALPEALDAVAAQAAPLARALAFYDAVTAAAENTEAIAAIEAALFAGDADAGAAGDVVDAFPVLRFIADHEGGAPTLLGYQRRWGGHGDDVATTEATGVRATANSAGVPAAPQVAGCPAAEEDGDAAASDSDGSIDWGGFGGDGGGDGDIDLGAVQQPWQVELEDSGSEGGGAAAAVDGPAATLTSTDPSTRLLACDAVRAGFEDELAELHAFVAMRLKEVEAGSGCDLALQGRGGTAAPRDLRAWLATIDGVTAALQSRGLLDVLFAATSTAYAARLAAEVYHKRHEIALCDTRARDNADRCAAAHDALAAAQDDLARITTTVKASRDKIERILCGWYAPRRVYLVGEVDSL